MPPVTIDQAAFYAALQGLKHVADLRAYMPVLSHVLVEASGDVAAATTTNLHASLTCMLPGHGEGAYLIPIKQALALVEPEDKPRKSKKAKPAGGPTREVVLSIAPEEARRQAEEYRSAQEHYHKQLDAYKVAKAKADAAKTTWVEGFGSGPPSAPVLPSVKVRVETPDLNGSMVTMDVDDFPQRPKVDWTSTVEVEVAELLDPLEWAMLAVSSDEGRPYLNGLLWHPTDGLVATDGHRLHKTPCTYRGEEFLLPGAACEHLLRILKSAKEGTLLVSVGSARKTAENQQMPTWVRFDLEPWSLVTREAEGRFPPWEKVVPRLDAEWSHVVRLEPAKLMGAVRRVQKVTGGSMRMEMHPGRNVVRITAEHPDEAGVEIEVAATFETATAGEDLFAPGFNPKYMLEAADGMDDSMTLRFTGPTDACRIDGENGRLAITMPMRL